jgi:carbon monoxide dehydrogenase subunit G
VEFRHQVSIDAPPDSVLAFLSRVEHVAECLPGARITKSTGNDRHEGTVRAKLTAVQVTLTGELVWSVDSATKTVSLDGHGHDSIRGNSASGLIAVTVENDRDGGSLLQVDSRIDVSGRLARLGQGFISDVAARIITDFARSVQSRVTGDPRSAPTVPDVLDVGSATAGAVKDRATRFLKGFGRK